MKTTKSGTAIYDSKNPSDLAKLRKTRVFSGGIRISENETYTVIGFTPVAATATIPAWTGVLLENSKGVEVIAGINQVLSQSLTKHEDGSYEMLKASKCIFADADAVLAAEGKTIKCIAIEELDGYNFQKETVVTKKVPVWEMAAAPKNKK